MSKSSADFRFMFFGFVQQCQHLLHHFPYDAVCMFYTDASISVPRISSSPLTTAAIFKEFLPEINATQQTKILRRSWSSAVDLCHGRSLICMINIGQDFMFTPLFECH